MDSNFYIPRQLISGSNRLTEAELLADFNFIVILAEPGAGKTELMKSLSRQLGCTYVTANVFRYKGVSDSNRPIVIDAFDELAKIDQSGIYQLFAKAMEAKPSCVYLSSRSSEWSHSSTKAFEEFFGVSPTLVRLFEFDELEQKTIFDNSVHGEDFYKFKTETTRYDLDVLLPNPQFLKLFAEAYVESGRSFSNKKSVFSLAIERLAKEANANIVNNSAMLSIPQKVELASELFTKILLSGADGVSTNEATATRMYPCLSVLSKKFGNNNGVLSTRLFKLGEKEEHYLPAHKMIAEYCAANYLSKRIEDSNDPLSLHTIFPVIAPNSVVRDELRGLIGWLATLGDKVSQEAAINLDPYAVLANGDPSQLKRGSKLKLIKALIDTEAEDPYFRRGDAWRRFNMASFFTKDIAEIIKPVLMVKTGGHLRGLILELMAGSDLVVALTDELREIVLAKDEEQDVRGLANKCLLAVNEHSHSFILDALIDEGSNTSLRIASEVLINTGCAQYDKEPLETFLRACIKLYPNNGRDLYISRTIGERYFIRNFISNLEMETIEWLLNALTKNLSCTCEKSVYECACRNGDSKVVGLLLDKYFELSKPPFDSVQVWKWVENLHYDGANSASRDSKAVLTLQQDAELRQGILKHVFSGLTDREHIFKLRAHKFGGHSYSHSGLNFRIDDIKFIVDLAFKQGNPDLWACFIEGHSVYRNKEDQGPHELRRYMRGLALEKPLFMRAWVKFNRASKKQFRLDYKMWHLKSRRREKRWGIAEDSQRIVNQRYVQDNREIVESGRDWGCLRHFSDLILHAPEEIENEYGDIELVKSAVRNCLDFIAPDIPDLIKLAELRCSSKYMDEETVLHAACLEIWRTQACLENIDTVFLMSLRTRLDTSCKGMTDIEQVELKAEIDRLIFSNAITPEKFLRQYLEPQLADSGVKHPQISLLISDEAFNHLRGKLSLEWLGIFLDMDVYPLSQLFEIAAQYADHEALKLLIQERCSTLMSSDYSLLGNENIDEIRMFWLMRGWYFFDTPKSQYWVYLKNSDKTMYELCERSGRLSRDDHRYWPKLTASKVESILDTFVEKFPKVDLPSSWGTSSPKEEKGYRFLTDVIWLLDSVESESAIPVIVRLIADQRFVEFHNSLKSMYASQIRKKASVGFLPPNPNEIVNLLDHNNIATVEGLRSLIIQELVQYQADIDGGEFNPAERFYDGEARKGEVKSTEVIAERLQLRLQSKEIVITSEHQVKNENRVDFTATKMISGRRRLLVTEVKGQWHKELYTAAAEQLYDRYSIHPDAEQQGVFLVIWFGKSEKVAGRTNHGIKSALDLKASIEKEIPPELLGRIDVFVLDVSRW